MTERILSRNETSPPEKLSLKLAIVGGGKTCKFFLELLRDEPFAYLDIELVGVCDVNPQAEGLRLAKEMGIYTTQDFRNLFRIKGLDGILELTNNRKVLLELVRLRPEGVGILEHNIGRLLRSIFLIDQRLRSAEQEVALEKMASDFLIHQTDERIVVLNPDFTIVECNEAYLRGVDKAREEVAGLHCYEATHGLSVPCSELGCPMMETLRTGESAHVIHEHPAKGEQAVYCDLTTYPLKKSTGEIARVIEIWRDITDALSSTWERRAQALKNDLKRLVQEDRMISLGKLVASSVHEINNPIQGLLTFCSLMQDTVREGQVTAEDLEKFRHYLSLMSKELERCGNIVSGLLSFSRQSAMEYKDTDLNEILKDVIALTRHKMDLQNIRLETGFSSDPLVIHGDVNQLQQCFLNLVFNAIEAMPKGGTLRLTSQMDSHGPIAVVTVEDTGEGIPQEDLDHIFDPFFTTKEEGEGIGLGLSIVHGIVRTHKGNMRVTSEVGRGTQFVLQFPVCRLTGERGRKDVRENEHHDCG